jgi:2-dehydro-3-deoxyglucarate aldolase/4-hydroxy-2-oxoheptanedioate aldolase
MSHSIKARLARGEMVNAFAIGRNFHPNLIQIFAIHGGFHGFWIDHEHVGFSIDQIETAATAGRAAGFECFVRIAPTDYALVTRCLESGACGVMAAQINNAEQAEQFVQWAKYAPRGRRGLNSAAYDGRFGNMPLAEFVERSNRETLVAIQIETAAAVENVDAIAAIDGVDHLFLGPSDLSQDLGVTGQFLHPKCVDAIEKISAACRKHGKSWGAVTMTPDHCDVLVKLGCQLISMTNDVRLINVGIKAVKQTFGSLFQ